MNQENKKRKDELFAKNKMGLQDIHNAEKILKEEKFTCVLCYGDKIITSRERGVKPLLKWIDEGQDLQHYCAADKVVGNGAAFLYVLLHVQAVYAPVMSDAAVRTLSENGITAFFDRDVDAIRNRNNTGNCPMEEAVRGIRDPEQALTAIREKLKQMVSGI